MTQELLPRKNACTSRVSVWKEYNLKMYSFQENFVTLFVAHEVSLFKFFEKLALGAKRQNEKFWDEWEKVLVPETIFTSLHLGKGMASWRKAFFNLS